MSSQRVLKLNANEILDLKVRNYGELLELTEECSKYVKDAEHHNRMKKLAWAKFFKCRKQIKQLKENMGLPVPNDDITPREIDFTNTSD